MTTHLVTNDISVRECFVPRPGYCFLDIDIEGLELATLAQTEIWVLGDRSKADFLNAGGDAHALTGSVIHGEDLTWQQFKALTKTDKDAKNIRNLAKVPNFGKPGGMANKTLVSFARTSYGLRITEDEAERIGQFWEEANPADVAYLDWVRTLRGPDKLYRFQLPASSRAPEWAKRFIRGTCTYCAAANSGFQWLGAEVAANIDWALCKATMVGNGALRRCRVVQMVYDQWLLECPIGLQTDAARELEHIVIHDGGKAVPDVQLRAEACAMDRWSKSAERVEKDGELLIWTPESKGN
jgi:DNA polymerase-1